MRQEMIREVINKFLHTAREIASESQHQMMMLVLSDNGALLPVIMPPTPTRDANKEKAVLRSVVKTTAARMNAIAIFTITEAWVTTIETQKRSFDLTEDDEREIMAQVDSIPVERKREVLMFSVESKVGNQVVWMADIGVDGGKGSRKIGEWKEIEGLEMVAGRFADMLEHEKGEEV